MIQTPLRTVLALELVGVLLLAQAPQQTPPPVYKQNTQPMVLPPGGAIPQGPYQAPPTPAPVAGQPQGTPAAAGPAGQGQTPAAAAPAPAPQAPPQTPGPQTPAAQPPATPPTQPAQPAQPAPNFNIPPALNLTNASLLEVIDLLARDLKINYILDPRVKGTVTINTYGEIKALDLRPLLETVLRMNGFQMVQVGNMYRIIPVAEAGRLPVTPEANATNLADDERLVLNLVFLKFVTAGELAKLLEPFNGEGAKMTAYDPANLLIIEDNSRNMKRTMDLIAMFDSDALAGQRVRSYSVNNGRPSDLVKELETIFKAYALSEKAGSVKFLPVDRIKTVIAVAPNPGSFTKVEEWIKKLDIPAKPPVGSVDNHVSKLKYGRAEILGPVISQLYGGPGSFGNSQYGQTQFGNLSSTGLSTGGVLGASGSSYGSGVGGGGGAGLGAGGTYGGNSGGATQFSAPGTSPGAALPGTFGASPTGGTGMGMGMNGASPNMTGSYLGAGMGYNQLPRIIPNPYDNTLLIQSTPEQWAQIEKLLEQLDVPPRQVLIDCKIYEVDLSGSLSYGVEYYLTQKANNTTGIVPQFLGSAGSVSAGATLSAGLLATQSRQLLAAITASDVSSNARLVASPSIIATDSIPAAINVGVQVPTLQSQAITGVQQGGNSLFANTIGEVNTGVTLGLVARINASGVVTLVINQQFSQPIAPSAGSSIQSPSFSQRTVSTQVTVADGDTVAIGGIIQDQTGVSTTGIPGLSRLPYIGGLFGYRSYTKSRTELLVFLTPRVIYDMNQIQDATKDLQDRMVHLKHELREQ